jgi:hypothetical protein
MNSKPLVGTWKLRSFEFRDNGGGVAYPWGDEVYGQVIYSADGYMSGSLMRGSRPQFQSSDVMSASDEECAKALKSYIGYAGTYSVNDNKVVHKAEVSFFPNWTNTEIERVWKVDGDVLTLSTSPTFFGGREVSAVLTWQRVTSN